MGNRAVLVAHDTTKKNAGKRIGIYLHWHGSPDQVKGFLKKAKEFGIRSVDNDDSYFWARLAQVIGNELSAEGENKTSLGINIVRYLDCHNWDNGVYYIDSNFDIVKQTDGSELETKEQGKEE